MTGWQGVAPFVVGVAGGTGSGKTTVSRKIQEAVGPARMAYIQHDYYYLDQSHLRPEQRVLVNYDHPESLETSLLVAHLQQLRSGHSIDMPTYDFGAYARKPATVRLAPAPVILVEGILIYTEKALREQMDMKIFVDTDADIRFIRRLRRDLIERGRTLDSVVKQYLSTVRPMHLEFVEPSKRYADVIVPEGGNNKVAMELIISRLLDVVNHAKAAE